MEFSAYDSEPKPNKNRTGSLKRSNTYREDDFLKLKDDSLRRKLPLKRSNTLTFKNKDDLLSADFPDKSYIDNPENLESSESDSDFSELDSEKRLLLRQKKTFCGIEVKKQFGFM